MPSVYELLQLRAQEQPNDPAIVYDDSEITYAELARRVESFGAGLRELGVQAGTTVGLLSTNRPEWVIAAFGTMAAGGTVAAFNTWSKRWDLDHLLVHSQCSVLVSLEAFRTLDYTALLREMCPEAWSEGKGASQQYSHLRELVFIGDGAPAGPRAFDDVEAVGSDAATALGPSDAGAGELVLYTSGSTARPKAVRLRQDIAIEHGYDAGVRMGVRPTDRIWLPVPLFWSYGCGNALMVAMTHGAALVLQEAFDPEGALDIIERERCTFAYTLPNITAAVLSAPGFSPHRVASLERGITIGSPRDVRLAAEGLGIGGLCNAYGSTEIYGGCCTTPFDWPLEKKYETQGPPLPNIQIHIRDRDTGAALPAGETGEITVLGQVTEGYLRQPDATSAAFNERGEFKTGDLGYLDEEGNIHFVGRATEMIRSGGINVAPLEIEDFLLSHDDVREVAVVGADDEAKGQVPVAFVRVSPQSATTPEALRTFCREHIAAFKVPPLIVVTHEELTKTDTGKLARLRLREEAQELWDKRVADRRKSDG
jgi:fatty-acyl-CoA synthase